MYEEECVNDVTLLKSCVTHTHSAIRNFAVQQFRCK